MLTVNRVYPRCGQQRAGTIGVRNIDATLSLPAAETQRRLNALVAHEEAERAVQVANEATREGFLRGTCPDMCPEVERYRSAGSSFLLLLAGSCMLRCFAWLCFALALRCICPVLHFL